MDRRSGNSFSFHRQGGDKQDKQKNDGHLNKVDESEHHRIKYIRYVKTTYGIIVQIKVKTIWNKISINEEKLKYFYKADRNI
jgi:hypothetical protein